VWTEGGGNTHYLYSTSKSHVGGGVGKLLGTNQKVSEQELNTRRGFNDVEHHAIKQAKNRCWQLYTGFRCSWLSVIHGEEVGIWGYFQ
jgi:hypothetical protein